MSGLTDEERELKRLAEAATPGPWQVDGAISVMGDVKPETWEEVCLAGDFMQSDEGEKKAQNEANARFIASFNPATALALLERVRKAEERADRLRVVGTGLANAAYNLKHQNYIPEDHRRSLDEGQRAWDAVLAGDAAPTTSAARRPAPPPETLAEACRQGAEEMREQAAQRLELSAAEHRAAKARATPDAHEAWEQTALTLDLEAMAIRDLSLPGDKS